MSHVILKSFFMSLWEGEEKKTGLVAGKF